MLWVDGSPLPPLLPYPLLSVRKRSSLDTTFHPLGSVPIPCLGPETGLDFERWTGVPPHPLSVTLNSYDHGWSSSSGPEVVSSIPSPLSGLESEDSVLARRVALATFVALILDWTLRSEVVEGISYERRAMMIESC